jgi:hypothetical protein
MDPARRTLPPQVVDALRRGRTVDAIKLLRESGRFGLAEAKSLLEWHARQNTIPVRGAPTPAPPRAPEPARPMAHPRVADAATRMRSAPPGLRGHARRGLSPGEVPRGGAGIGTGVLLGLGALVVIYLLS